MRRTLKQYLSELRTEMNRGLYIDRFVDRADAINKATRGDKLANTVAMCDLIRSTDCNFLLGIPGTSKTPLVSDVARPFILNGEDR